MSTTPPSGTVRAGYTLVTAVLVLALVFGALTIVSVGMGVARDGESLLYGNTFGFPAEVSPGEVRTLPPGIHVSGWPKITVDIKDPTTKQMLLRSAMDFAPLVLFIAGLWLLRRFLRSVMDGDPFGAPNVQRLRSIGFLLVLGGPFVELFNYALRQSLFNICRPIRPPTSGPRGSPCRAPRCWAAWASSSSPRCSPTGPACARTSRAPSDMAPEPPEHRIAVHLDRLLEERGMTLTELAERVDVTVVNLSILKNGRARAVRFSTLTALCEALDCQPGDLLAYEGAE